MKYSPGIIVYELITSDGCCNTNSVLYKTDN